jgi:hypothetical protein
MKNDDKLGLMVHACSPSTWEAEAGGLCLETRPDRLQNETVYKKDKILVYRTGDIFQW